MAKLTKKQKAAAAIVDSHKLYDIDEAVKLVKEAAEKLAAAGFDMEFSYLLKTTRKTKQKQQALTT